MPEVKSRRELYSEATRAALLEEATALFAERGYAGTSLEDVASASRVTRGAVYHHFASKQALFEAVLDRQEARATEEIIAAAGLASPAPGGRGEKREPTPPPPPSPMPDPWESAMLGLDAYLTRCCDPVYGRLVWLEGPAALGWHRWRECEREYAYGVVERFIRALIEGGYLADRAVDTQVKYAFWMLGGAGLALAEAPEPDKPRLRDEWGYLIRRTITAMRIK
jgi:AcrR family transcriptional regulator